MGFAQQWGYGSLLLVNLFSFRATAPAALSAVSDTVGLGANRWLRRAGTESQLLVAAWGNGGQLYERASNVAYLIEHAQCLGVTAQAKPMVAFTKAKQIQLILIANTNSRTHSSNVIPDTARTSYISRVVQRVRRTEAPSTNSFRQT